MVAQLPPSLIVWLVHGQLVSRLSFLAGCLLCVRAGCAFTTYDRHSTPAAALDGGTRSTWSVYRRQISAVVWAHDSHGCSHTAGPGI